MAALSLSYPALGLTARTGRLPSQDAEPFAAMDLGALGDSLSEFAPSRGITAKHLALMHSHTAHAAVLHALVNVSPSTYTVRSGDSLAAIAARFSATTAQLLELNQLAHANMIHPGMVLKLRTPLPRG